MRFSYRVIFLIVILLFQSAISFSDIYRYQDEDGVWRYTDTPVEKEKKAEVFIARPSAEVDENAIDLAVQLKNAINEKKVHGDSNSGRLMCIVQVISDSGTGTGFFISRNGYILTNKHVARDFGTTLSGKGSVYEYYDEYGKEYKRALKERKRQIEQMEDRLSEMKRQIDAIRSDSRRAQEQRRYDQLKRQLQTAKADYEQRKRQFSEGYREYERQKSADLYRTAVAGLESNYTVKFYDGTETAGRLVQYSQLHDLAVIKVDGYRNAPLLRVAVDPVELNPRQPLKVMGHPLERRNIVTSGTYTGLRYDYLSTNATVQPGNSGGPLLTSDNTVVGVITLKEYKDARGRGGYGLAIPLYIAYTAFEEYFE